MEGANLSPIVFVGWLWQLENDLIIYWNMNYELYDEYIGFVSFYELNFVFIV